MEATADYLKKAKEGEAKAEALTRLREKVEELEDTLKEDSQRKGSLHAQLRQIERILKRREGHEEEGEAPITSLEIKQQQEIKELKEQMGRLEEQKRNLRERAEKAEQQIERIRKRGGAVSDYDEKEEEKELKE